MMRTRFFHLGFGALLLGAGLFCLGDRESILAVALPVLAHELGHLLALWILGMPVRGFRLELRGFCIEYGGGSGAVGHVLAAAAGPLAGLAYALAAARLSSRLGSDWLRLSAGVSLLLTLFNLLPALPLDGGTILLHLSMAILGDRRGRLLTEVLGLMVGAALLGGGFYLMVRGQGAALALAAVWLLLAQEEGQGLVKRREII